MKSKSSVFDGSAFKKYLIVAEGKEEESANRINADVAHFFNYASTMSQSTSCNYTDLLLDTHVLLNYFNHLKLEKCLAPTTVADKIKKLHHAIDYTILENKNNLHLLNECNHVNVLISKWGKSLSKEIKKQRIQQSLRSEKDIEMAKDPSQFWEHPNVTMEVNSILQDKENTSYTKEEHNLILAYLSAILIYNNAQRPGIVENMTIDEFMDRQKVGEKKVLIRVFKHKTSITGPANVIINCNTERLMLLYLQKFRANLTPITNKLNNRLFLTYTGNSFRKIYETIKATAETFCHIEMPTPSVYRKLISTTGFSELDERDMRSLNKHMSHSYDTSKRYYQLPPAEKSVVAHNTISKLKKKAFFTKQEDDPLLKEWPLSNTDTPSLRLCEKIASKYNMNKTKKQLQDRWKTMKKNST